jgi:hypothetical protein
MASDETWRAHNTRDSVSGRFWGQIIYQLGLPHTLGTRQAQIALERTENVVWSARDGVRSTVRR